jgi:shikimate kinase
MTLAANPDGPIVLIGPPGVGKSTAGAKLAEMLDTTFRDTDADIEAQVGKPVADIFVEEGEAVFRDLEREAATQAIRQHKGVVALGSGAILDDKVTEAITQNASTVVYLAADFTTVAKRAGLDRPRVVLPGNPRGRLRAMLDQRRPRYEALAAITIQADDAADPAGLAAEIATRLGAGGAGHAGQTGQAE